MLITASTVLLKSSFFFTVLLRSSIFKPLIIYPSSETLYLRISFFFFKYSISRLTSSYSSEKNASYRWYFSYCSLSPFTSLFNSKSSDYFLLLDCSKQEREWDSVWCSSFTPFNRIYRLWTSAWMVFSVSVALASFFLTSSRFFSSLNFCSLAFFIWGDYFCRYSDYLSFLVEFIWRIEKRISLFDSMFSVSLLRSLISCYFWFSAIFSD